MISGNITRYLKDSVTVNKVTMTSGRRSSIPSDPIRALIFENVKVHRKTADDEDKHTTVVYMEPDVDITVEDEVDLGHVTRPVRIVTFGRRRGKKIFKRVELM